MDSRLAGLLSDDPLHHYSDDELDAIESIDAEVALRIARAQFLASQQRGSFPEAADAPVEADAVIQALDEARQILARDGGDIELVEIDDREVKVRMKGACAGCPNSVLDLRNVVEKIIRTRVPGVRGVSNVF